MIAGAERSPRKPKGQGAERRGEILDAAQGLFAARGVLAVSTRDIAAAVGISQPALYAHFRSGEEIRAELCERAFRALGERMRALPADSVTDRGAFLRMCRIYIDFGLEQPDAYRVAFMLEKQGPGGEPLDRRILGAGIATFEDFEMRVGRLVAAGLTRPGDVRLLTQSLWAGLHGLVSLLLARTEFPWVDIEVLVRRHLDMLADGVLAPPPVSPRR